MNMNNTEKNYITIIDSNGLEKKVEVLNYFTLNSNGKDYVAYTENKEDANGNIIIATSEVIEKSDGSIEFANITDQNVLNEVKNVLFDLCQ